MIPIKVSQTPTKDYVVYHINVNAITRVNTTNSAAINSESGSLLSFNSRIMYPSSIINSIKEKIAIRVIIFIIFGLVYI